MSKYREFFIYSTGAVNVNAKVTTISIINIFSDSDFEAHNISLSWSVSKYQKLFERFSRLLYRIVGFITNIRTLGPIQTHWPFTLQIQDMSVSKNWFDDAIRGETTANNRQSLALLAPITVRRNSAIRVTLKNESNVNLVIWVNLVGCKIYPE